MTNINTKATTTKGKPTHLVDGYAFTVEKMSGDKTIWSCGWKSHGLCRSRLHTINEQIVRTIGMHPHPHPPSPTLTLTLTLTLTPSPFPCEYKTSLKIQWHSTYCEMTTPIQRKESDRGDSIGFLPPLHEVSASKLRISVFVELSEVMISAEFVSFKSASIYLLQRPTFPCFFTGKCTTCVSLLFFRR